MRENGIKERGSGAREIGVIQRMSGKNSLANFGKGRQL